MIEPGSLLKNSALVIMSHQVRDNLHIVLCWWANGKNGEFITWFVDSKDNAEVGIYSDNFLDVYKAYQRRVDDSLYGYENAT